MRGSVAEESVNRNGGVSGRARHITQLDDAYSAGLDVRPQPALSVNVGHSGEPGPCTKDRGNRANRSEETLTPGIDRSPHPGGTTGTCTTSSATRGSPIMPSRCWPWHSSPTPTRCCAGGWSTGSIYRQCAKHGWPVHPTDAERNCLYTADPTRSTRSSTRPSARRWCSLREHAISGEHKWDPAGGSSLSTYFVRACIQRFPNVYRRWSREFQRRPPTDSYSDDDRSVAHSRAADDVEQQIVSATLDRGDADHHAAEHARDRGAPDGRPQLCRDRQRTGAHSARAVEGVVQRYRARNRPGGARS